MRRIVILIAVVVAFVVAPAAVVGQSGDGEECSFPVTRTDATGTDVTVSSEPSSVVSLNPSAAQTMWEIGAKDKVVGVTKFASNLEGAEEKTNISTAGSTISNELVVGLEPDLVLAPNTITEERVGTLRDAGLTVYRFEAAESIDDIENKTELIGGLVGECAGAADAVDWMEEQLADVDEQVAGRERPDALHVFFEFTAGTDTFTHEVIERAGGNNVAADAGIVGFKPINEEVVVQQDPDWFVLNTDDDELPDSPAYQNTTAAREGQIVVVDSNQLSRPAPRIVHPVQEIADAFHPQLDANVVGDVSDDVELTTETVTATATPTPEPTPTATERPTATATEAPTATTDTPTATATQDPTSTAPETEEAARTATATDAPEPTATQTTSASTPTDTDAATTPGATTPGFGPVAALVGVALALGVWRRSH